MDIYALWGIRVAFLLIMLGLLWPSKRKRTMLAKILRRSELSYANTELKGWLKFFDRLSEHPMLLPLMIKPGSEKERQLSIKLLRAGIPHIHPNIVQVFRILLPPIGAVLMLGYYLFSKLTAHVVSLAPVTPESQTVGNDAGFGGIVRVGGIVDQTQVANSDISLNAILIILLISMLLYYVPDMLIKQLIKRRAAEIKKELPVMEMFIVITLESGTHTVYETLKTLLDTTTFFRPYLTMCLNEFHVNPKQAIQNMADRVGDEEFQIVCNGLKQAVDVNKQYTAVFMQQHLDQIRRLHELQREAKIKKKPMIFVFLLALPLINVLVVWFYPWFVKAMRMLSTAF